MMRALPALTVGLLLALGCSKRTPPPPARAAFGVFFGGQVQEREELPLVHDRSRQTHGLRITFDEPPRAALRVSWELEKDSEKDGGPALTDYGDARARVGEPTLDIPFTFKPKDRPGTWRIRVDVEERRILDRAFRVVPPPPALPPEDP